MHSEASTPQPLAKLLRAGTEIVSVQRRPSSQALPPASQLAVDCLAGNMANGP